MKTLRYFALAALASTPVSAQDLPGDYRPAQGAARPAVFFYQPPQGAAEHGVAEQPRERSARMSGGPAREFLIREQARVSLDGTVYDQGRTVPFGDARSGTAAGGQRVAVEQAAVSLGGTVYDPARTLPFGSSRSGTMAGGPRR
jgi:hypothetical protein